MWLARFAWRKARTVMSRSSRLSSTSRISIAFVLFMFFSFAKGEMKYRAMVHFGLGPYPAAVTADDALHDGQANPRAFKILRPVEPLEHAKQLVHILHIKPNTVVAHKINIFAVFARATNLHDGRCPVTGVLDRVGLQVDPDLLQQH